MARRREDRTLGCLLCGDVLAIYVAGERAPDVAHQCATHDALDRELYEAEEMLDEARAAKGEDPDAAA